MKKLLVVLTAIALGLIAASPSPGSEGTGTGDAALPFPEIPRITIKETRALLGDRNVAIIDARPVEQWKYSDQIIPHAVHEDPMNVDSWVHKYAKDKTLIIYCA
jgi:hypothetical protein